jgi:protein-S-isoprenylcysteine O-methyltransferase Ste14
MWQDMNTKLIALYVLDQILSIVGAGVALFWSAGRLDWGAAWAALAVWLAFFAAMDILRTALEDRTLQAELAGYVDYARQVRYRLLPGIW